MKNIPHSLILILLLIFSFSGIAQTVEKIKFKKDSSLIYFFQKGIKTDTLYSSQQNLFYLVVPAKLKKDLSIQVENGQLLLALNDSLVKLNYLPGFQYESFYVTAEVNSTRKEKKTKLEFTTMVNGTSILKAPQISIRFINKNTGGILLENVFYYKNN